MKTFSKLPVQIKIAILFLVAAYLGTMVIPSLFLVLTLVILYGCMSYSIWLIVCYINMSERNKKQLEEGRITFWEAIS